jgi:hypothetical protein
VDLERLVAATPGFDVAYVRRWLEDILPPDDERRTRFDRIVATFGTSSP